MVNALSDIYPRVRRLIPLHLLPESDCRDLCRQLVVKEAVTGECLFQRGDEDSDWIYLLEGEVALEADGILMEQVSGVSDAARFPLAHQVPRKLAARALTDLQYIRIDHRRLRPMEHYQDDVLASQSDQAGGDASDWMTKLFKSPVFQRLPASNLQRILQRLQTVEVSQGDRIIVQGEAGDCLYILRSGICQVTRKPRPNAREIKLGELRPGDLFGEDALLSGQPRAVDVTMCTDGVVLRLEKEDFLSLVVEPLLQKVSFESAFREVGQESMWLDVRDPDAYRCRHLEGSLNIPFFSLRMQLGSMQRQRKYILVCDQGDLSAAAAFLLLRFGFEASVLAGGLASVPAKCLVGEGIRLERVDEPPKVQSHVLQQEADFDRAEEINGVALQDRPVVGELWDARVEEIQSLQAELDGLRKENEELLHKLKEVDTSEQTSAVPAGGGQAELEEVHREKQVLEAELQALRHRVSELEAVIQQYCEAAQAEGVDETIRALETELNMVRERADEDVTAMRQQVEEARHECDRLSREMAVLETRQTAALPSELVAVDPERLPLQPPAPQVQPNPGWTFQVLWLLVGVLLSLAGAGIGLQTEHGRHLLLTWLQEESSKMPSQPAAQSTGPAGEHESPPLPDEQKAAEGADDLFAE